MKTITFYSYKGGTGRSLAVANAARYLARLKFKVVALDFDLEAPGLHYKFAFKDDGKPLAVQTGIVDYLYEFIMQGAIPSSLEPFVITIDVPGTDQPLLRLIPAGRGPSPEYWEKLSRIDWHGLFYAPDAKGVQLFLDFKQRIIDELQPDFLLIDSRTGITEMGGVAATLLADRVICLVLPTLENMEGARAVLRSLKRTRREMAGEDIELMLALSRLPDMKNTEEESAIKKRVQSFFNDESENMEETLCFHEIFILHSERALELREAVRIGGNLSRDESLLLRDYLLLFATLVPQELLWGQMDSLTHQARIHMWEDSEIGLQEMEELAESTGHPEIYRALFQFYKERNTQGIAPLKNTQRFWELHYDTQNPWFWVVIQNSFKPGSKSEKGWSPNLDFIMAVWRDAGAYDETIGFHLAEAYNDKNLYGNAADVLLVTLHHMTEPTPKIVAACLNALQKAKRSQEAENIIGMYQIKFRENLGFIKAWAEFALDQHHLVFLNELAKGQFIEKLAEAKSLLPLELLEAIGSRDNVDVWLTSFLALHSDSFTLAELYELGRKLRARSKWGIFEKFVRSHLHGEQAEDLLRTIKLYN